MLSFDTLFKIKELEQKLSSVDLVSLDLREKLARSEDKIIELQNEMDNLVEEADEKLTLLRQEKEDVLAESKKATENAITDIRERMTNEKTLQKRA